MTNTRIFKLNGQTYKYENNMCFDDETRAKTLSILNKTKDGKDEFTPVIQKSKYGENAYSYENFKTGEVVLADNFRSKKVFDVTRRVGTNIWDNRQIGSIQDGKVIVEDGNRQFIHLLNKIKVMIKSF